AEREAEGAFRRSLASASQRSAGQPVSPSVPKRALVGPSALRSEPTGYDLPRGLSEAGEGKDSPDCTGGSVRGEPRAAAGYFGKYQLLAVLARGGMGIIYKARDTAIGRVVALKMTRYAVEARSEDITRFLREATAAQRLCHPNIVPVYEAGVSGGQHYFTM